MSSASAAAPAAVPVTRDLSTPDIPASAAVVTCYASTRIKAPAALVFRTLRNSETWKDWNQWIPRVDITHNPANEDLATTAEIAELVRNTSIAGSFDSEITDGAINGPIKPTPSDPNFIPPPVTRQRLASNASRLSSSSNRDAAASRTQSVSSGTNGAAPSSPALSGAAKFQASQAARKASIASGGAAEPMKTNNVLVESPMNPNLLMPAPGNTAATQSAVASGKKRNSFSPAERKHIAINALYGEPSVRIQLGTKMTFHCRMKMPSSYALDTTVQVVVTEVSRPDDVDEQRPFSAQQYQQQGDEEALAPSPLMRSKTHTLGRTGVYRIVWSMVNTYTSPTKLFPKFMLQAQRVHEIRRVINGDGSEECIYEDWELQRGVLAKTVKTKYGAYLQARFERWGKGLGEFCESMGGAVERRDFISG